MLELPEHLVVDVPADGQVKAMADWNWLIGDDKRVVLIAASGDVFLNDPTGGVWWLETGTATFKQIARSSAEFECALNDPANRTEWLFEPAILRLRAAGNNLGPGECYSYRTLPVLGGEYEGPNRIPMKAAEHIGFCGYVHNKIKDLPEGTQISLKWVDSVGGSSEKTESAQPSSQKKSWWRRAMGR